MEENERGIVIDVKVKPNSKKFSLEFKENMLFITLKNKAEGNKANDELINKLEKLFKNKVIIIKGKSSSKKKLFIENLTIKDFKRMLRE